MKDKKEVWSFFSGAMGLDLGLETIGLGPTVANEIDPRFCETIRRNRPLLSLIPDSITTVTGDDIRRLRNFDEDVFLMVGGPPCQPFSSGGKRAALNDARGNLIYEYFRLISEVEPRYFVLENVANLATAALRHRPIDQRPGKHWSLKRYAGKLNRSEGEQRALADDELSGTALRQIVADASSLGYYISFGVLDAADYGAPQHRLRFVMLGARDRPPPFLPEATHGQSGVPYRTVKDAIWHLRECPGDHSEYTPEVRAFFDLIPPGGNWRRLPPELQRAALGERSYAAGGGKTGFYRRLDWDRPSPTITGRANRKGSALCHPAESRPISVQEAAALQGFPADWRFVGAMSTQYLQIGNAVPIPLGQAIGRAILKHHASRKTTVHPDHETMLANAVARLRASARNRLSRTL